MVIILVTNHTSLEERYTYHMGIIPEEEQRGGFFHLLLFVFTTQADLHLSFSILFIEWYKMFFLKIQVIFNFIYFTFWPCHVACRILVPQIGILVPPPGILFLSPGIEPMPLAVEAGSLNPCTSRDVPNVLNFMETFKLQSIKINYLILLMIPGLSIIFSY